MLNKYLPNGYQRLKIGQLNSGKTQKIQELFAVPYTDLQPKLYLKFSVIVNIKNDQKQALNGSLNNIHLKMMDSMTEDTTQERAGKSN